MGSTNVILSVKPQYAEAIVQGKKKYELRRSIFTREDENRVYVYSTSPVSKIVGSFEVEEIVEDSPEGIWEKCHRYAAIPEADFFRYFDGAETAFAIKITRMQRFADPLDPRSLIVDFKPPQSFCYLAFDVHRNGRSIARGQATRRGDCQD